MGYTGIAPQDLCDIDESINTRMGESGSDLVALYGDGDPGRGHELVVILDAGANDALHESLCEA